MKTVSTSSSIPKTRVVHENVEECGDGYLFASRTNEVELATGRLISMPSVVDKYK